MGLVRLTLTLLKKRFKFEYELISKIVNRFNKKEVYEITITEGAKDIIEAFRLIEEKKLDDVFNYIPSRIAAFLILGAAFIYEKAEISGMAGISCRSKASCHFCRSMPGRKPKYRLGFSPSISRPPRIYQHSVLPNWE